MRSAATAPPRSDIRCETLVRDKQHENELLYVHRIEWALLRRGSARVQPQTESINVHSNSIIKSIIYEQQVYLLGARRERALV